MSRRSTFVADTSVFIDSIRAGKESWGDAFAQMHARCDVIAPLRAVYEIGNIVHRKYPKEFGKSLEERQKVVLELLQGITIDEWRPDSISRCGELAEKHGITYYDATFLDLALRTPGARLVVQDEKLRVAASAAMDSNRVCNLDGLAALVARGEI